MVPRRRRALTFGRGLGACLPGALQYLGVGLALLLHLGGELPSGHAQSHRRPRRSRPPAVTTPTTPVAPVGTAPVAQNLPLAAVRLECSNDGQMARLCETVLEGAIESARHKYQLLPPEKLEELLGREASLRGCRRDECRSVIAEKLGLSRLIDIIIQQAQRHRRTTATVLVFDPLAKGIAADQETQLKDDEAKVRSAIVDAVDRVVVNQRLSAALKLEVLPADARVTIADGRGGSRVLTDTEREGKREVRLFLGTYTVHVEKPGFITQDPTITVAQAGAALQVELKTQPVKVKFDWSPPEARVLVDGDPVDVRDRMVELPEGVHHVEALAPRGQPYESTVRDINVKLGMEPVRIALQRLTELRIQAPQGYTVSVDNQLLPTSSLQASGDMVETAYPITSGVHTVNAVSWRGLSLSRRVEVLERASTEAILRPPALAPGIALMALGAASLVTGGVLLAFDGKPSDSRGLLQYDFKAGAAVALGGGGLALLAGSIWFGRNAANHPRFHRTDSGPTASLSPRLLVLPSFGLGRAGVLTEIKF